MSILFIFFFFSSRRRHTRLTCDWSSDVCSSDLPFIMRYASHDVAPELHGLAHQFASVGKRQNAILGKGNQLQVTNIRSEERRVGKECRSRWTRDHYKEKVEFRKECSRK